MNIIDTETSKSYRVIRESKLETGEREIRVDADGDLKLVKETGVALTEDINSALDAVFESAANNDVDIRGLRFAFILDDTAGTEADAVSKPSYKLSLFARGLGWEQMPDGGAEDPANEPEET
jgi:hypothetical protein